MPHIRAILNTNFATFLICSKHKFCHIFEPLWFYLFKTHFQWFTYSFHSHYWWVINSWLIFFTRFSWLVVFRRENREYKMARICGKICVCCIGHHMNKCSFKHFYVAKFIPPRSISRRLIAKFEFKNQACVAVEDIWYNLWVITILWNSCPLRQSPLKCSSKILFDRYSFNLSSRSS